MNGIAFYGKMGAGKSTLANALKNYYKTGSTEYHPVIYSFGTGVKKCAKDYFDTDKKDRDLLVGIGMGLRDVQQNVWVDYLHRTMQRDTKKCQQLKMRHMPIVDDLRFKNEYDYLKENGFKIIKVSIDPLRQEYRLRKLYPEDWDTHINYSSHVSENNNLEYHLEVDSKDAVEDNLIKIKTFLNLE
jgi:hypothetical protein